MTSSGYFNISDVEMLTFYKLPKALFSDPRYRSLSLSAKVLYSFMLERVSLSMKNSWVDEDGNVYIYYSIDQIRSEFNVSKVTAIRRLDELEEADLLDRIQVEVGTPSRIYLKKIAHEESSDESDEDLILAESLIEMEGEEALKDSEEVHENVDSSARVQKLNPVESVGNSGSKNCTRRVQKLNPNKTDINKTDYLRKRSIDPERKDDDGSVLESVPPTIKEASADYTTYYTKQLDVDAILKDPDYFGDQPLLHEIVNLCSEITASCDQSPSVKIGRRTFSSDATRKRFMKLTGEEVKYFIDSFNNCAPNVRNPKAYILSSLYNAPETLGSYKAVQRHRRKEVLPAYYYEKDKPTAAPSDENSKPVDREALLEEMRRVEEAPVDRAALLAEMKAAARA